jgi:hypothetical protein
MRQNILLNGLENKVLVLLDQYKDPLIQVLRYREEAWFVPREIELPAKHIIKNFQKISEYMSYTYEHAEFSIQKKDANVFLVSTVQQSMPHEVKIYKKDQPATKHWAYRNIHYKWMIYEELHLSGNTYNHILSQAEKIKEWTDMDLKAWLLTEDEKQRLNIRNKFHDIPEYKDGDIICSSKTAQDSSNEDLIAEEIIDGQDRSDEEKTTMKDISHLHSKQKLFKLYEIMFYTFDIQNMIQNRDKHNNSFYLAGATLWYQIPKLIRDYELPNWKILYWLDIPSCADHLRKNSSAIDNAFAHVEKTGVAEKRKNEYTAWKQIWEDVIKPYIINKK